MLNPDIVSTLKSRGTTIWNGTTFSLSNALLDSAGAVTGLDGYLSSYYDMVSSADYLEFELLAAGLRVRGDVALNTLPSRSIALVDSRHRPSV